MKFKEPENEIKEELINNISRYANENNEKPNKIVVVATEDNFVKIIKELLGEENESDADVPITTLDIFGIKIEHKEVSYMQGTYFYLS